MWLLIAQLLFMVATDITVYGADQVFTTDLQFEVKQTCTAGLYENDVDTPDYKLLKNNVETAIRAIYRNYPGFYSTNVKQFYCSDNLRLFVSVIIKTTSDEAFNTVVDPLRRDLEDGFLEGTNIQTEKVISKPGVVFGPDPVIYAELKTEIFAYQFCDVRANFKRNLASYIISADGLGTGNPDQIFFSSHQCNKISERFKKAEVQFYISAKGSAQPDIKLTELAYKVINQMIYDGSTWKLSLGLRNTVKSISLEGSAAPTDDDLTDLEIIYIGVGAVAALLLLIIIIILIINCCCHCCDDEKDNESVSYKTNGDSYELESHDNHNTITSPVSDDIERGYTNPIYLDEKPKREESPVIHYHQDEGTNHDHQDEVDHMPPPPDYDEMTVKVEIEEPVESVPDVLYDEPPAEVSSNETSKVDVFIPPINAVSNDNYSSNEELDGEELSLHDLLSKKNDPSTIDREYNSIPKRMPTALIYPSEAITKNREPTIFPWPEQRVLLNVQENDLPITDYINASYIRDATGKKAYIATQSPLKSTVNDFWKMVWEQESKVIVIVTPLTVHGQEKCYQYWPSDSIARHYGQMTVQLKKKELKPDFIITSVSLTYKGVVREVRLFRYMSWPQDGGVPDSAKSTLLFLFEVHDSIDVLKDERPIFHCSNGIGMAAVLIVINEAVSLLEKGKSINIKRMVANLRKDLAGAVETNVQYHFIYEALYQYAVYLKDHI